jgi:2-haloacid dehalogenase
MASTRRQLLLAGMAATLAGASISASGASRGYRAIAFDGFPIFDLRPLAAKTEALFPGQGAALTTAWRTRQFEYQWLRALANDYADFLSVTQDGLVFAARSLKLELTHEARDELMGMYSSIGVWPDVPAALKTLRDSGLKLAIVSNMTQGLLDGGLRRAGLEGALDHVLSTDAVRSFKPSPLAYRLGVDALRLDRKEILFAPFAGWDAAGAKAFGHPTYWVNRLQAPVEEWGVAPDGVGRDLGDLVAFVNAASA